MVAVVEVVVGRVEMLMLSVIAGEAGEAGLVGLVK